MFVPCDIDPVKYTPTPLQCVTAVASTSQTVTPTCLSLSLLCPFECFPLSTYIFVSKQWLIKIWGSVNETSFESDFFHASVIHEF